MLRRSGENRVKIENYEIEEEGAPQTLRQSVTFWMRNVVILLFSGGQSRRGVGASRVGDRGDPRDNMEATQD
jgi:hypothetical protein